MYKINHYIKGTIKLTTINWKTGWNARDKRWGGLIQESMYLSYTFSASFTLFSVIDYNIIRKIYRSV